MIDREEFLELTKKQALLQDLEPRHLERLTGLAREFRFDRDEIIFREGDRHAFFYLIVEGSVALESAAAGHPQMLQILHAGGALGWPSLLDSGKSVRFQARALAPTRVLAFDGGQLRAACESDPVFGYSIMKALAALLAACLDAARLQLAGGSAQKAVRAPGGRVAPLC